MNTNAFVVSGGGGTTTVFESPQPTRKMPDSRMHSTGKEYFGIDKGPDKVKISSLHREERVKVRSE
jgi:hypothetical protein